MRHFLPKRSSSEAASSRPKSALTQQPPKLAPVTAAATQPSKPEPRWCSRLAKCYHFSKRQGPLALDSAPPASSWSKGQKEEGAMSCRSRTTPQTASCEQPVTPSSSGYSRRCVCYKLWACSSIQLVIRCYSDQNKTNSLKKRAVFLFHFSRVPCPLATTWHSNQFSPCLPGPRHGKPSPECQSGFWG